MASFRKRAGGWRAEIAILGTRESKTSSTKAEATAWASERETEIRRGADSGIVLGKSCGEAFDRYLEEVSKWKWLAASPTSDMRRPKPAASRERIPTEDEIERLCNALGFADEPVTTKSQAVAVAYLVAIKTAMRAGEICGLMPTWVDGAVARLPASINKNGMRRDVPLSTRARALGAAAGHRRGAIVRYFHSIARCPVPQSAPALMHRGTNLPRQPARGHHTIGKKN